MEDTDDGNVKKYDLTGFQIGVAGACGGIVTRFFVQPLDVLKIRFQLQVSPISKNEISKYTSIPQAIRLIIREEGISALWKGHIPGQYLSIVFGAVQFTVYEKVYKCLYQIQPYENQVADNFVSIVSGSVAGFTAVVVSFPFDVLRTHLVFQGEPKIYKGVIDAAMKIYQKEGIWGFKNGMLIASLQMIPMSGLLFGFRSVFSHVWLACFQNEVDSVLLNSSSPPLSTTGSFITGLFAGLCAKTLVFPADLIKKRLQIQNFCKEGCIGSNTIKCNGILNCLSLTLRNEGFFGLFKGFSPTLIKTGASSSLYFTVYDKICQLMQYS